METACPKCGYSNNGIDAKCANCSAPLQEAQPPVRRRSILAGIQTIHVFVAVALLATLGYAVFGAGNWTTPSVQAIETPDVPDEASIATDNTEEAWIIMCDFAKERVRAPGTAAFPARGTPRTRVTKLPNAEYEVLGYVDFEGEGNRRVRRYFKGIVIQYRTGLWKLQALELDYWDAMARYFVGLGEPDGGQDQ